MPIFEGTKRSDTYVGELATDNTMFGRGGDDVLFGGAAVPITAALSVNTLFGGTGSDILYGGNAIGAPSVNPRRTVENTVYGGEGEDVLFGGRALNEGLIFSTLFGRSGDDVAFGGQAVNGSAYATTIVMGNGDDVVYGGSVDDGSGFRVIAYGGNGDDLLTGALVNLGDANGDPSTGENFLFGGRGDDVLEASRVGGNGLSLVFSELFGEAGEDTLYGGAGIDTFWMSRGQDTVFGFDASPGSDVGVGGTMDQIGLPTGVAYSDIQVAEHNGAAVITAGGQTMILIGVSPLDVTEDFFR